MKFIAEEVSGILERWNIRFARFRTDLEPAGSPERSLARTVVQDDQGRLYRLEKINFLNVERKNEIARIRADLGRTLPEIIAPLPLGDGAYIAEIREEFWQTTPFIEGLPLDRPAYAGEGWRGPVLADFLVRLKAAAVALPDLPQTTVFSVRRFVEDLEDKLRDRDAVLHGRILPAIRRLEEHLFPEEDSLPAGFAHGDFHPLNIVWSRTGIRAVVDWEFCGWKPELYDAALLVGCLGMEHPRFLDGDFVRGLLESLQKSGAYAAESWKTFFDLVLALRFAWLSDWLRRADAEMIDLEAVYLGLLLEKRDFLIRCWGLPA